MAIVVFLAEVMTVVWFLVFLRVIHGLLAESRGLPQPRLDPTSRVLIGAARLAFMIGLPAIVLLQFVHDVAPLG